MARATGNVILQAAKKAKQDEFYTQWVDIEREMNAYLEYDPDVFRGKIMLLPCDDPEWSNFTKFFALHFADFGIEEAHLHQLRAGEQLRKARSISRPSSRPRARSTTRTRSRVNGRVFTLVPEDLSR